MDWKWTGIGAAGFEPTTPTTPKWCATKLRYAPYCWNLSQRPRLGAGEAAQQAVGELLAVVAAIAADA